MGVERIKRIVKSHRCRLQKRIEDSLITGWREWSTKALELQTFWADQENRLKEGRGFYKMDKSNINKI